MNIVVVCRGGNTRSVAAKMILHRYLGHEAIPIGAENTSFETKKVLFNWADKIVVTTSNEEVTKTISEEFSDKVIMLDVGNDIWGNPFAEDLQAKIVTMLNSGKYNELTSGKIINIDKVINKLRKYQEKLAERRNESDYFV